MDALEPLGLEPTPGFYRYRACRGAPWQPVRIIFDGAWHCLLIGKPAVGSGTSAPMDIPFLLNRWPLHPITQREYLSLVAEYARAKVGSPLMTPNEPVDLRRSIPL